MFRWMYKLPLRFRSLFRREEADRELSGELRFHLDAQIQLFIAQGMAPDQARCAAIRELGGMAQIAEECREMRRVSFIQNLLQDVRFAWRTLRKNPGFTFVVVLTLALGMGASTAIFSLVNSILLRQLPYAHPERLVGVFDMTCPKGGVLQYQQRMSTVEIAAYTSDAGFNLSGNGDALRLTGSMVSSNLFGLLGAVPQLGRAFVPGDETPGKTHIVILSNDLWKTKFGGNPTILGRFITLDDVPREVVGVMPPEFKFPAVTNQLWTPIEMDTSKPATLWGSFLFTMVGRLRDGVTLSQAQAEYKAVVPQAVKAYPWAMGANYGKWSQISSMHEEAVFTIRPTLMVLLGAVTLVLLIACANVANLLLARSSVRQREIAVRTALGAGRARIVTQLLTESVVISLCGGAAGCALAYFIVAILKNVLTTRTAELSHAGLDLRVLAFSALVSVLTGLAFGMAPAWRASRANFERSLHASANSWSSVRTSKLSTGLVVLEVALAVVLVSGAGLLIKSLWQMTQLNAGFRTDHLVTAHISPTTTFCRQRGGCTDFYRRVLEQVSALPGVKAASVSDTLPLQGLPTTVLAIEDRPEYSTNSPYMAWEFTVSPSYLVALEVPLLSGRNFTNEDTATSPGVVLVSKTLAQQLWPGQNPLGKRLKPSWQPQWRTVIGVVDDVLKYKALSGRPLIDWAATVNGDVYFPFAQGIVASPVETTIAVRAAGDVDASALVRQISAVVASINSSTPVSKVATMDQLVSDSVSEPRSTMWVFVAFSGLALLLGIVGIYSVISYSVAQRTREIGIRMAIGADRWEILTMVLRQGSLLTVSGIVLGLICAKLLTRVMAGFLYGITPAGIAALAAVALLVGLAALTATYIPSRRATKVDPTIALKYE